MNRNARGGTSVLDLWLEDARTTLRETFASSTDDISEPKTVMPGRPDPEQRTLQRDFLAKQLTELARRSDPSHRPITPDLIPTDWTTFADFEFALRMWDAKSSR